MDWPKVYPQLHNKILKKDKNFKLGIQIQQGGIHETHLVRKEDKFQALLKIVKHKIPNKK